MRSALTLDSDEAARETGTRLARALQLGAHLDLERFPEVWRWLTVVEEVADPEREISPADERVREAECQLGEEVALRDRSLTLDLLSELLAGRADFVSGGCWSDLRQARRQARWRQALPGLDFDQLAAIDQTLPGGVLALLCAHNMIAALPVDHWRRPTLLAAGQALESWLACGTPSLETIERRELAALETPADRPPGSPPEIGALVGLGVAHYASCYNAPAYRSPFPETPSLEVPSVLDVLIHALPTLAARVKRGLGAWVARAADDPASKATLIAELRALFAEEAGRP